MKNTTKGHFERVRHDKHGDVLARVFWAYKRWRILGIIVFCGLWNS